MNYAQLVRCLLCNCLLVKAASFTAPKIKFEIKAKSLKANANTENNCVIFANESVCNDVKRSFEVEAGCTLNLLKMESLWKGM